jgi:hypothetical protein
MTADALASVWCVVGGSRLRKRREWAGKAPAQRIGKTVAFGLRRVAVTRPLPKYYGKSASPATPRDARSPALHAGVTARAPR